MDSIGGRPLYYDREAKPMTLEQWVEKFRDLDYKVIARDYVEGFMVSTVWMGIDHGIITELPIIFETMIFAPEYDPGIADLLDKVAQNEDLDEKYPTLSHWQDRYATEQMAREGHEKACEYVRDECLRMGWREIDRGR